MEFLSDVFYGSLTIYITFVTSSLVWCSFKEPLSLHTASFPMMLFNAWIISRLLIILSTVATAPPFKISSQLLFLSAQSKVHLDVCKGAVQINIQLHWKHLSLVRTFSSFSKSGFWQ